ncbi:efflux RND transporter periplasmic adaptor subunit [Roseimicrobium sp. ORNL1]|uniref:efflux RND transporter periplasmic adaptor subunit n=1 Tax=Roseimicrobium sp. ORNL1 TaxID=2711231 RepID=UPI0013E134A2|nr:efflux RND transporter periplasmic adaptor subunit [Roseimicrobium sp. ORNL1]QIF03762.1 efflux RND transporter periplasmic adaptor subunit [Roseimicrobium sp. ORNL1]
MQKNLSISALALVSVLALSACGRHPAPTSAAEHKPAAKEVPPVPVTVAVAEERPMPRYLQVSGELKSGLDAAVAANAAGKVMETPMERGSVVKAGDVLVKLDDRAAALALREAEAHVNQAQSRLDFAIAEWKRNEPLAKTRAISAADYEKLTVEQKSARADLDAAIARRDTSKKNLDDMVIRAPFAGSVMERRISPGEYVQLNTQVVQLVANDHLRLLLNVPETAIGSIEAGQEVTFEVPAFPGRTFTGVVKYIGAALRQSSRDLMVEANVPNLDGVLKQGMFAEGRLLLPEKPGVAVPKSAIRTSGGQPRVFVVEHEQVTERLVDLGEHQGDWLEIRSGVSKGETVVTDPAASTVDGVRITVAMKP